MPRVKSQKKAIKAHWTISSLPVRCAAFSWFFCSLLSLYADQLRQSLGSGAESALQEREPIFKDSIFSPSASTIVFEADQALHLQEQASIPHGSKPDLEALETLMLTTSFSDRASPPSAFNQGREGNIAAVSGEYLSRCGTMHTSLSALFRGFPCQIASEKSPQCLADTIRHQARI